MKIERQHYELAYQLGRRIQKGEMRLTEARDELARAGVNPNSAIALLNNFRHMLEGTRYTRAMSSPPHRRPPPRLPELPRYAPHQSPGLVD